MQPINYATFPILLDELDALQAEIDSALKRTWLMLGSIILPCAGLVIFALANAGK